MSKAFIEYSTCNICSNRKSAGMEIVGELTKDGVQEKPEKFRLKTCEANGDQVCKIVKHSKPINHE